MSGGGVKWRTAVGSRTPERVTVTRETEHYVSVVGFNGRSQRERKVSSWSQYHGTYAEARAHLVERAAREAEQAEAALERARARLREAFLLPETEPEAAS